MDIEIKMVMYTNMKMRMQIETGVSAAVSTKFRHSRLGPCDSSDGRTDGWTHGGERERGQKPMHELWDSYLPIPLPENIYKLPNVLCCYTNVL